MEKVLTMCAAVSSSGGFCGAGLDASEPDEAGEVRLCSASLHRFAWEGRGWTLDLSFDPPDAERQPTAAERQPTT